MICSFSWITPVPAITGFLPATATKDLRFAVGRIKDNPAKGPNGVDSPERAFDGPPDVLDLDVLFVITRQVLRYISNSEAAVQGGNERSSVE